MNSTFQHRLYMWEYPIPPPPPGKSPFPSCPYANKTNIHKNGFGYGLSLKRRLTATQKGAVEMVHYAAWLNIDHCVIILLFRYTNLPEFHLYKQVYLRSKS